MLLKIGQLARQTGLTVRTLPHYDAIGLLRPSGRADNGYRLYNHADVARLYRIQTLRRLGLSLEETDAMLAVGVLGGYLQAAMMTWLQRRLRADMLGRGMALLMFVLMGLAPLSAAVTGWLLRVTSLATVLAGAGLATLAVVAAGFSVTRLRRLAEA